MSDDDIPRVNVTPGMLVVIRFDDEDVLGNVVDVEDGEWVRVFGGPRIHVDDIKAVALYRDQADFVFGGGDA